MPVFNIMIQAVIRNGAPKNIMKAVKAFSVPGDTSRIPNRYWKKEWPAMLYIPKIR
jgi:hypothetical protein